MYNKTTNKMNKNILKIVIYIYSDLLYILVNVVAILWEVKYKRI
jgi:hypothetical protein